MAITRRSALAAGVALQLAAAAEVPVRLPKKIRLGLVGFDGHPGEILDPLPRLPDVELAAVCADAAAVAKASGNPHVSAAHKYQSLVDMLDKERLDVVAVCNNNGERAAAVIGCAERKLNVISEKPLAINIEDFSRVRQTVERQGVSLGLLVPMRFEPPFAALRQIVAEGQIGEVIQVSAQKSYKVGREEWRRTRATYGSTILWIGIHMIDLMRWTSGREFTDATGWQTRVGFPEMRDQENVSASVFRLDNGGLAILRMDYLRPRSALTHGDDRLRLAGTKGVAEYSASSGVTLMTETAGPSVITRVPAPRSVFVEYLLATYGGKEPQVPMSDIWKMNEIALAAHESAANGAKTMRISSLF